MIKFGEFMTPKTSKVIVGVAILIIVLLLGGVEAQGPNTPMPLGTFLSVIGVAILALAIVARVDLEVAFWWRRITRRGEENRAHFRT